MLDKTIATVIEVIICEARALKGISQGAND
jgi:hypothetical protein